MTAAFTLLVGCSDMGTGCDTILAQMAADCLDCELSGHLCARRGYGSVAL